MSEDRASVRPGKNAKGRYTFIAPTRGGGGGTPDLIHAHVGWGATKMHEAY